MHNFSPVNMASKSSNLDLSCNELTLLPEACKRAYEDKTLLQDDRVLTKLLVLEEKYQPSRFYLSGRGQTQITARMRKMLAAWMLEVSTILPSVPYNLETF